MAEGDYNKAGESDHGKQQTEGNYGGPQARGPIRRAVRTTIICGVMLFAWLVKPFKFLHGHLPAKIRELIRSWDSEMLWVFILSLGSRVFMDQNCRLKDPPTFKPLVKTRPEWQFTEEQIQKFYKDGFIGPITLWTPDEMKEIRARVERVLEIPSKVYPKNSNHLRDRYIDRPEFWEIISAPQIKERLAQLLGPDLMVWRSQIFNKRAGDPEITWHQASTYLAEQRVKATLEPRELNELFQLTTWIAIDDAYFENGCMHFLKGTHRKMTTMRRGGSGFIGDPPELAKVIGGHGRFAQASGLTLEIPITEEMIVPMPLKSGQCVIFSERCIHGSPPNNSDRRRFGFVFRTIKTDTTVYREEFNHQVTYLNDSFDLSNWGCALLRGQDQFHLNRMIEPPKYDPEMVAAGGLDGSGKNKIS